MYFTGGCMCFNVYNVIKKLFYKVHAYGVFHNLVTNTHIYIFVLNYQNTILTLYKMVNR
mgnify:CR=1 FL=1